MVDASRYIANQDSDWDLSDYDDEDGGEEDFDEPLSDESLDNIKTGGSTNKSKREGSPTKDTSKATKKRSRKSRD